MPDQACQASALGWTPPQDRSIQAVFMPG